MPINDFREEQESGGGVTLWHLLLFLAFIEPVFCYLAEMHRGHAHVLLYILGGPIALAGGALIAWVNWVSEKWFYNKVQHKAFWVQGIVIFCMLLFNFVWVGAGMVFGFRLASFMLKHVA